MLRCKEGDLAVILEGPYTGYMVTVGKYVGTAKALSLRSVNVATYDKLWIVHGLSGAIKNVEEDRYLQPIRPAPSGVTTETKKEITA